MKIRFKEIQLKLKKATYFMKFNRTVSQLSDAEENLES